MSQTVLAIDDDPSLLSVVERILSSAGYNVLTASTAEDGWRLFRDRRPDLVLLDVMMPDVTGWELCKRIRSTSAVPCIFLTGRRAQEDTVHGLDMGADDYIAKPFHTSELRARVAAVLRRSQTTTHQGPILSFNGDDLVIDTSRRTVQAHGQDVALTPTEYNLLLHLAGQPNRVLTTDQIISAVWGNETDVLPANVKWYVWRLRQKIERVPSQPRFIITVSGVGYRFGAE